jgi:hypothetical protein
MTSHPRFIAAAVVIIAACAPPKHESATADSATHAEHAAHAGMHDAAYDSLQARGKIAMGVDQYTSTHKFDPLPDGGRIELQRDSADSAGVATIRAHLRGIAEGFQKGDFDTPSFVHAQDVPGTRVMTARRSAITYSVADLPRGGEIRITSTDSAAVAAIHEFLAFQRQDHRVGMVKKP